MAEMGNGAGFSVTAVDNRDRRCESCLRRGGRLHRLIMPKATQRYPENEIKVRLEDRWLCDDCYAKLCAAMENEGEEKGYKRQWKGEKRDG